MMKNIYCGGYGTSIEDAVIINSENTVDGVEAEYNYISNFLKTYTLLDVLKIEKQELILGEKQYDVLHVLIFGRVIKFYFDITSFYGKM